MKIKSQVLSGEKKKNDFFFLVKANELNAEIGSKPICITYFD